MNKPITYRVQFINQETVYEIYARQITESEMFGFMEVEQLVFGESSSVLVDPAEEKIKNEFKGVTRTYIPMHHILRIDEVTQQGVATITDYKGSSTASNVHRFPTRPLDLEDYEG